MIKGGEQIYRAVQAMCNTLNVSASGYYGWRGWAPSARAVANDTLIEQIRGSISLAMKPTACRVFVPNS